MPILVNVAGILLLQTLLPINVSLVQAILYSMFNQDCARVHVNQKILSWT